MPRALITHADLFGELGQILMTEHTSETDRRTLHPTIVYLQRQRQVRMRSSGADRMDRIIHLATTLKGYELSFFQRCCMDAILPIVAPVVFKGCAAHELGEYLAKKRWKASLKRMIFLEISRRSGKTDLLTLLAAIFLVVLPALEMLGWSLYNETSALFGRTMVKWLVDLGLNETHSKHELGFSASDGHVFVFTGDAADVRVIYLMGSQNPNVSFTFTHSLFFLFMFKKGRAAHAPLTISSFSRYNSVVISESNTGTLSDSYLKGSVAKMS